MEKRLRDLKELQDKYGGVVILTLDPVDAHTISHKCKSGTIYHININEKRGAIYTRNVDDEGVVYVDRG